MANLHVGNLSHSQTSESIGPLNGFLQRGLGNLRPLSRLTTIGESHPHAHAHPMSELGVSRAVVSEYSGAGHRASPVARRLSTRQDIHTPSISHANGHELANITRVIASMHSLASSISDRVRAAVLVLAQH